MDRQLALQRGFQALEDEFARLPSQSVRRQRRTRNRPRVQGSWRDQGKGECWTKTGKGGGAFVVCEGSKGQKGVYDVNNRNVRGDEDQKGRKKDKAIKNNRSVMKKYDVEGRVEDLDEEIYFTPLREEGGFVILGRGLNTAGTAKNPDGISENVDTVNTIRVPKDEFNAQYRVMRGFTNPDDKYNDLAPAEYKLQEDPDKAQEAIKVQREVRGERLRQEGQQERVDEFVREAQELGGGREGFRRRQRRRELGRQAIRKIRETQQDRLNREQRQKELVESFESKINLLKVVRGRKERVGELEDWNEELLARLERQVGQELDRRERIRREEREERERREQREIEERDEQEKQAIRRAALRTVRERRAGAIQPNQFYLGAVEGDVLRTDDRGFAVSFAVDKMRAAIREAEKEEGVEEKKVSKKDKKISKKDKQVKKMKAQADILREQDKDKGENKKERAKVRAKEAQGDDFDEEDWEEEWEEYRENRKQYKKKYGKAFNEEPIVKRIYELTQELVDNDAELDIGVKIDKDTGVRNTTLEISYKGNQDTITIPRHVAIEFGYDGTMKGTVLEISLKATIDKLEKLLAS